jgi:general L-amino acid transport system permease protein
MTDTTLEFTPVASRPPPRPETGLVHWLKKNLFDGWNNTLTTLLVLAVLALALPPMFNWGIYNAVYGADNAACRAAEHVGACWGVVAEKYRVFLTLMHGGVMGLVPVETARWGGFPLTVMLSTLSLLIAFPLAVLVALGRQSRMPGIRTICVVYVELIRGVPLISVLFMASFMLPLFMPQGSTIDVLVRVLIGMTLFTAAYLAEVVRGGLQALPKGQVEAAQSLGLGYWQTMLMVVLPQALRLVVPATMNTFIGAFKDTSLVTIVSLYDLTGALQLALGDADWRKFFFEGQLFVAGIYFVFCYAMSRYSQWIEQHLNTGTRRQ